MNRKWKIRKKENCRSKDLFLTRRSGISQYPVRDYRLVVNSSGTVVQSNHYYPFGMASADTPIANQGLQPYKYNGKELDMMSGLNQYDYSARYYDPAIARFTTMDPMAEKYYNISPYAYCANNPVNAVDPDGRDFQINFQRDKDGNITGMIIQAKVYITGTNASEDRAADLNKLAKDTYKSQTINGVKVSFDISYEYSKDITAADLGKGENLLDFNNKETTTYDRSHVNGSKKGSVYQTGNTGEIYSDADNGTVMHETGHLVGLADRYDDIDAGNLGTGTFIHPGYENDLMSGKQNTSLDKSHYGYYMYQYGKTPRANVISGKVQVERNSRGFLMTPYEKGKIHHRAYE